MPFFTEKGSFWTNGTTELLASTSEQDRQGRTRNRCNGEGYESVALIPLRFNAEIIGLLQLNDKRKDMFTPDMIGFYEKIGASIAVALARKQAVEQIESLSRFPNENPNPALRIRTDGTLIYANDSSKPLLDSWNCREGQKLPGHLREVISNVLRSDEREIIEITFEEHTFVLDLVPIKHAGYLNIYGRDITDRKKAEKSLGESETKFRALVETTSAATFIHRGAQYCYVNPAMAVISGFTQEELLAMDFWDLVHPDVRELVRERGRARHAGEQPPQRYEAAIQTKNGEKKWIDLVACFIEFEGQPAVLGTFFDITDRKIAEGELRRKEEAERRFQEQLRHLHEVSNELSIALSFDDLCRRAVELGRSRLGFDRLGIWFFDQNDTEFIIGSFGTDETGGLRDERTSRLKTRDDGAFQRFLVGGGQCLFDENIPLYNFSGEKVDRGSYALAGMWDAQNLIGYIGMDNLLEHKPITPHDRELLVLFASTVGRLCTLKRAEEDLRESEEKFFDLYQNAPVGYHELDRDGRIVEINQTEADLMGYTREEMLGRSIFEFIEEDGRDTAKKAYHNKIMERQPAKDFERTYIRKDGSSIYLAIRDQLLLDENKQVIGMRSTVQDVTDRKHLEDQLRQAQKMEAVGQLAGGVAHDFNNIVMIINGYCSFAMNSLGPDHEVRGDLEEVKTAADRAASLTRQLLAFSRKQVLQPVVLNLNSVVDNMDKMLRRVIGEHIELATITDSDLGNVKADPGQIEQILLNLAVNARDAMPQGGKLTIETANVDLGEDYARQHVGATPGPYVLLALTDTGVGMDAQTLSRVFEPFFTTKEKGKGTGLGLSTVYGIVKQSGGYIWVYSEPGQGTTFKIYLPQIGNILEPTERKAYSGSLQGSETILIVEDEAPLRELLRKTFEKNGYTVLVASNGEEALRLCQQSPDSIDLLVTDVVMP
ncbi:MAG: PAS domain S-box protein, partial [bacterium]